MSKKIKALRKPWPAITVFTVALASCAGATPTQTSSSIIDTITDQTSSSDTSEASEASKSEENKDIYDIYLLYRKDALSEGKTPLSYDEWLKSIKGEPGDTPYIGDNGDWWIGNTDTGVSAAGEKGEKGDKGDTGASVLTGRGEPTSGLGQVGDSYIDLDTFDYYTKTASGWIRQGNLRGPQGEKGDTGEQGPKGDQGERGPQGEQGEQGQDGKDGQDGQTPFIGANGNWWIGDQDTGIAAQGPAGQDGKDGKDGQNGVSIGRIEVAQEQPNEGQTLYIIYDTNGNELGSFVAIHGQDGEQGIQGVQGPKGDKGDTGEQGQDGKDGKDGQTPFIGANGNWWIGNQDTGIKAQGPQGEQGETGAAGQDGKDGVSVGRIEAAQEQPVEGQTLYIIYDTNNNELGSFVVVHGQDGAQGIQGVQGPKGDTGEQGPAGQDGADGLTPTIGYNGNWWIGDQDTGIAAQGPAGQDGKDGKDGQNGVSIGRIEAAQVQPNEGQTLYIIYDTNGNELGSFVVIHGQDGAQGIQGVQGPKGDTGEQGPAGQDGKDGQNGLTPFIGENGNWWIGEQDTGIAAQGPKGDQGPAGSGQGTFIGSIEAAAEQPVDGQTLYIIYDTNGDELGSFVVVHGQDGAQGIQGVQGPKGDTGEQGPAGQDGQDGADGLTPFIGENGNWWIGEQDTGVKAQGNQGEAGQDGKDGADGQDGKDGTTPHIGENGNWWIGEQDTGIKAQGPQGEQGETGAAGQDGQDGKDGVSVGRIEAAVEQQNEGETLYIIYDTNNNELGSFVVVHGLDGAQGIEGIQGPKGDKGDTGAVGQDGADGLTPFIGENGNWWIGEQDTGIKAQGPQGETGAAGQDGKDGVSVGRIEVAVEQPNEGETLYIIYDTKGNELGSFAVIHGQDGTQGIQGPKGDKGEAGEQGPAGQDGKDGADGLTPFIGENGNWWIGEQDTGIKAQGPQGEQGETGAAGQNGASVGRIEAAAEQPAEGQTLYIIYDTNNNELGSFVVVHGQDGAQGIQGIQGPKGDKGDAGAPGQDGQDGADGLTPFIGENGNWWIGEQDTGIKAQGPQGEQGETGAAGQDGKDGLSVLSIAKTSTNGLVDTYTITYSDNTTSTFNVTNGAQGIQGVQGEKGEDGHTPTIAIDSNGHWVIDGQPTEYVAIGQNGVNGQDGEDGKDGVSIVSVEKTATEDLVDTYTITYSDESTSTFTVTNGAKGDKGDRGASVGRIVPAESQPNEGETLYVVYDTDDNELGSFVVVHGQDGAQGIQGIQGPKGDKGDTGAAGQDGKDGLTPFIGENGNWWIGEQDTGIKAQGPKGEQGETGSQGQQGQQGEKGDKGDKGDTGAQGDKGDDGKSAYEIYCESHPDYQGNEEQWMDDLVNGRLADKPIYTVTFETGDGSEVPSQQVEDGKKAGKPENPERPGYEFIDWVDENGDHWVFNGYPITEDITLYATWSDPIEYTVTFKNEDGSVLYETTAHYGDEVEYPYTVPTFVNPQEHYEYAFAGWDKDLVVTGDMVLTAQYSSQPTVYQVRFVNNDGSLLYETSGTYGQSIQYLGETPSPVNPESGYIYEFDGWDKQLTITGDMVITARYIKGVAHTYTFINPDGSIAYQETVPEGATPSYMSSIPTYSGVVEKDADGIDFDYFFAGWKVETELDRATVVRTRFEKSTKGLIFSLSGETYYVSGYTGSSTEVVVPSGYNGKAVVAVGNRAFSDNTNIASIVLPDSVNRIGESAFSGCTSLTNVRLPGWQYASYTAPDFNRDDGQDGWQFRFTSMYDSNKSVTLNITSSGYLALNAVETVDREDLWHNIVTTKVFVNGIEHKNALRLGGLMVCKGDKVQIVCGIGGQLGITTLRVGVSSKEEYRATETDSVTSIGQSAFSGCSSLISIAISDSVMSIGFGAFEGCSFLTSVDIGKSVASIGKSAFSNCSSLELMTLPFVGGSRTSNAFLGYIFGAGSYWDNSSYVPKSLKAVVLNSACESIGECAFRGCSSLISIAVPDSVTSIGGSAFSGCSSLTSIVIPDSVTSIGNSAFCDCSSLTSIVIPDSVTSIVAFTFDGCTSLEDVYFAVASIERFVGITGKGNLIGNVHLIDTSTGNEITEVAIPDSVTSIGKSAFSNCSSLISIAVPDSVTSIGEWAFYGCSSLASVAIGNSVASIGGYAFDGCSSLTSVAIGNSVASIGDWAFRGCSSLEDVYFAVASIERFVGITGKKYLIGNVHLIDTSTGDEITEVTVPDSVTSIPAYAFFGCSSLKSMTLPFVGGSKSENAFLGYIFGADSYSGNSSYVPKSLKTVILSSACESIGGSAFRGCSSLTSVAIPNSVASIGGSAFCDCSSLTSIVIPDSVTSIGEWAFSGCSSLESMVLPFVGGSMTENAFLGYIFGASSYFYNDDCVPESLKTVILSGACESIGGGGFYLCSFLESIVIPDSVTSIGKWAFFGCSSLTSVDVGKSVASIGEYAFAGCSSLTSIAIHDSVTSLGEWAFSDCSSLESIVIPDSVISIGRGAFLRCSSLTSITLPFVGGSLTENTFLRYIFGATSDTSEDDCVPESLKVVILSDACESINKNAFRGCSSLESIVIPDSVTSIGERAFYDCSSLESIVIPDSVASISYFAFSGCSSLTSIVIPDSVTSIGSYAFDGCSSLADVHYLITSMERFVAVTGKQYLAGHVHLIDASSGDEMTEVTVPDSVTSIGEYAFYGCSSLTSVTIGSSVTSIGRYAFSGCSSLASITFAGTKAQWASIQLGSMWNENVPTTVIHCSDGDVTL